MGQPRYISESVGDTSSTFPAPAGVRNGDTLLLLKFQDDALSGFAFVDPPGWTPGDRVLTGSVAIGLWYKTAGGSEPATYDIHDTTGGHHVSRGAMVCYRDAAIDILGIFVDPPVTSLRSANWPSTALGVTLDHPGLIVGMWWWRTGPAPPSASLPAGFTQHILNSDNVDNTVLVADAVAAAGPTGDKIAGLVSNFTESGDLTTAILVGLKGKTVGMAMMV